MSKLATRTRGATIVEFALVLVILLTLIFGAIEFGRAMFLWNSAVDATRRGARAAAIVEMNATARIVESMNLGPYGLQNATVLVDYSADGTFEDSCTGRGSCMFVRVGLSYTFTPLAPYVPSPITMPTFSTTLPVEALGAT